jgi:hypothetical protein
MDMAEALVQVVTIGLGTTPLIAYLIAKALEKKNPY